MTIEVVNLLVDGVPYDGWEFIEVSRNLRNYAGRFSFGVAKDRDRFLSLIHI